MVQLTQVVVEVVLEVHLQELAVVIMTSTIKVNNIQNQCGANIINESANTITIGASGDTISLASGASQSGFGRTGTVDWQTGSIKTATFTAANGEGYFANTSGGAFTMNLPAGSAGAIVSVVDYTNTFQTNNLTITPNGSEKIGGVAAPFTAATEGQSLTFVYVDGTEGWKNVQDSTSNAIGNPFIVATGGTITTVCTNYKVHTFTGPGTFTVTNAGAPCGSNTVDYLVIAGGGSGGGKGARGGGGAGGYRESGGTASGCYAVSPLGSSPSPVAALPVSVQGYSIAVGAGGVVDTTVAQGLAGNVSTFSTITSAGGGGGNGCGGAAANGGSGGAGTFAAPAGLGNQPPVSPPQGNPGGSGAAYPALTASGGGGAGAPGGNNTPTAGGAGGAGATSSINGTPTTRGGGGGGGVYTPANRGPGGAGGGGQGADGPSPASAGTANTGGGGGGAGSTPSVQQQNGASGGSGIVIIRYKFQ
jgi:hypothetical protein